MSSVGIHPPKTPVTKGCNSIAKATIPNVCKMPGPPAPFVPSPLPNIAKSGMSPKGFSKKVKIEGSTVAIRGASYKSMGDMASKGTGGGLISANTHGPAKFITPGSLTVKIEGKSVHLLGEPMLNNCGASGNPPNTGATLMGTKHDSTSTSPPFVVDLDCEEKLASGDAKDKCDVEEMCAMVKSFNESKQKKERVRPSPSNRIRQKDKDRIKKEYDMTDDQIKAHNQINNRYGNGLKRFARDFTKNVREKGPDHPDVKNSFAVDCRYQEWKEKGANPNPSRGRPDGLSPDHTHDVGQGGSAEYAEIAKDGLKYVDSGVNQDLGNAMKDYDPDKHGQTVGTDEACQCD